MVETNLFIFEIINNDYSHLINILVGLTKKEINILYNNIITIIVEDDTIPLPIAKYFNRIYINKSSNALFQVLKKKDFLYDNLIHIYAICDVDISKVMRILNYGSIYTSHDPLNLICKIIPNKYVESLESFNNFAKFFKNINFKIDSKIINSNNIENYNKLKNDILNKQVSNIVYKNKITNYGLVTVIMTCYNSEDTINYSLISLLNQTYENLKIIIVDDCSYDNTVKKINNLIKGRSNVKLIVNKKNRGTYYSKNIGLKNIDSTTEFITFHDSDDISKTSRIDRQVKLLVKKKLLACACLGQHNNITKMTMATLFIKISVFRNIGFFNLRRYGSDEEYFYRIFALYVKDFDWNPNQNYISDKTLEEGYYKKYKNFRVLLENQYNIYKTNSSLTNSYKQERKELSQTLIETYQKVSLTDNLDMIYLNFEYEDFTDKLIDISDSDSFESFNYESNFSIEVPSYSEKSVSEIPSNIYNSFICTQAYVSDSLVHLKYRFLDKYHLYEYYDRNLPSLFFGIYNIEDINKVKAHKSDVYIIWGGTDFDYSFDYRVNMINSLLKYSSKIKLHYGLSSNLMDRLTEKNLICERIYLNLVDKKIFKKVDTYGDAIFVYNGLNPGNEIIYGKEIYEKVEKNLPNFKFIYSNQLKAKYNEMPKIYSKCFIGLRLTKKDGNANMVQELIEMGIPVIHNGEYPTIKWQDEKSITESILNTYKKKNEDINDIYSKNYNKNILIIFNKDINLKDGAYIWLQNIVNMFKSNFSNITVICKYNNENLSINTKLINIESVNLNFFNYDKYDYVYFRPYENDIIAIDPNIMKKMYLFLNSLNYNHLNYYNEFKKIFVNSILIKDELEFNGIKQNNVDVIPPLYDKLIISDKNEIISFVYSGTLKKEYMSLELLNIFKQLSYKYKFIFYLYYGKIKESNTNYDNELEKILIELKDNNCFYICKDENRKNILNKVSECHYGIVIHNDNIDKKQQSTKLIEYLSLNCIPIKSLNYLNNSYYTNESDLTFENLYELSTILKSILNGNINYDKFKINTDNLKKHSYEINLKKIYQNINFDDITTSVDHIKSRSNILISNIIQNRSYCKVFFYLNVSDNELEIHSRIIKSLIRKVSLCQSDLNFLNKNEIDLLIFNRYDFGIYNVDLLKKYYNIIYDKRIFDIEHDKSILKANNCNLNSKIYSFEKNSYLHFQLYLLKNKFYFIEFEIGTECEGYITVLFLTYFNDLYQDINRNLHVVQKNNKSIIFTVKIEETKDYEVRIRPSCKNNDIFMFTIKKFRILEVANLNDICDDIKIINMEKDLRKFVNVKNLLESNHITVSRAEGVDGNSDEIVKQYENYKNTPLTNLEKKLGRKLLASPGAFGYLYSMKKIFREAIIKNFEYIIVFDDDIGIIDNFLLKIDDLFKSISKPKLLMFGSSQWDWDDINFDKNTYFMNEHSNGSFANMYHRTTFEEIYYELIKFNDTFDGNVIKQFRKYNKINISYPNLVIAQLEESNIILKKNKNRTYERFRWTRNKYNFNYLDNTSNVIYKDVKSRINKKLFIIGITTYNRCNYLNDTLDSLLRNLSMNIDYILIISDGNSKDNTINTIKSKNLNNNISLIIISNSLHFIYRQSNSILKYSLNFNFDFGFLMNDDLIFLNDNWDVLYYNAYIDSNYDHLVYFDKNEKAPSHEINHKEYNLFSFTSGKNCQGALFTFTKKLIESVGYFDEENFKIRGHSHIDYTLRCCRQGFNNIDILYDLNCSNNYIKLNNKQYISSFQKLPFLLRELHKVDIYEQLRRAKFLDDEKRLYINSNFLIENI